MFDCLDLSQLLVPPALQLARCQAIAGVHRIVLFKRLLRLILQLLQFVGQGGSLCGISAPLYQALGYPAYLQLNDVQYNAIPTGPQVTSFAAVNGGAIQLSITAPA